MLLALEVILRCVVLYAARTTWPNSQNNGFTLDWVISEQAQCQQPAKQISVGRQQRLQPLRFVSLASWMSQLGYDWQATRVSFSHVQHGPHTERPFEQQNTNPFLLMSLSRQELRNGHREHAIWPVTHIRRPNLPELAVISKANKEYVDWHIDPSPSSRSRCLKNEEALSSVVVSEAAKVVLNFPFSTTVAVGTDDNRMRVFLSIETALLFEGPVLSRFHDLGKPNDT